MYNNAMTSRINFSRPVTPVTATAAIGASDNDARKDSERKRPEHQALADEFARHVTEEQSATPKSILDAPMPNPLQIGVHNALAIQNALKNNR